MTTMDYILISDKMKVEEDWIENKKVLKCNVGDLNFTVDPETDRLINTYTTKYNYGVYPTKQETNIKPMVGADDISAYKVLCAYNKDGNGLVIKKIDEEHFLLHNHIIRAEHHKPEIIHYDSRRSYFVLKTNPKTIYIYDAFLNTNELVFIVENNKEIKYTEYISEPIKILKIINTDDTMNILILNEDMTMIEDVDKLSHTVNNELVTVKIGKELEYNRIHLSENIGYHVIECFIHDNKIHIGEEIIDIDGDVEFVSTYPFKMILYSHNPQATIIHIKKEGVDKFLVSISKSIYKIKDESIEEVIRSMNSNIGFFSDISIEDEELVFKRTKKEMNFHEMYEEEQSRITKLDGNVVEYMGIKIAEIKGEVISQKYLINKYTSSRHMYHEIVSKDEDGYLLTVIPKQLLEAIEFRLGKKRSYVSKTNRDIYTVNNDYDILYIPDDGTDIIEYHSEELLSRNSVKIGYNEIIFTLWNGLQKTIKTR